VLDRVDAKRAAERRRVAAEKYRPREIELLLVAEAPPADLDRYFYFEDVHEHDALFRYVCRGVLGVEPTREKKAKLLRQMHDRGVFLIDLQEVPRDGTPLTALVPALVERCQAAVPKRIILIKATVFDAAFAALRSAGLPVINKRVPFPVSGQQRQFEAKFREALDAPPPPPGR
jgi:hypothetical protein